MAIEIPGMSLAISKIGRWSDSDLALIERITLSGATSELELEALFQQRGAEGWPNFELPMYRVVLRFEGAFGLKLNGFGGGNNQVTGFYIDDISYPLHQHRLKNLAES